MESSKDRYVDECPYSKTGWAWWMATGGCTCIPAKKPDTNATSCACDTNHPLFKERGHHPLCPLEQEQTALTDCLTIPEID